MPIYTYRCSECGVQFERQQSLSDPAPNACPECGEDALQKVFTPVGIVFRGSGFYSTDHRPVAGQEPSKNGKAQAKPDAKADGKGDAKSEAKPASPPPSKDD